MVRTGPVVPWAAGRCPPPLAVAQAPLLRGGRTGRRRPLLLLWGLLTFNVPFLLIWAANRQKPVGNVEVKKTDAEWREQLSPAAYDVLIKRGTERSGTSSLNYEKRQGTFCCAGCRAPLFEQRTKFESGTGWPSFWDTIPGQVDQTLQLLYCLGDFGAREVRCHRCGGHLGHVFSDGPAPTGKRYCINGVALEFQPEAKEGGGVSSN